MPLLVQARERSGLPVHSVQAALQTKPRISSTMQGLHCEFATALREAGFDFVALDLDLENYASGSMNRRLPQSGQFARLAQRTTRFTV
jgi:hypothetical protein